MTLRVNAPDTDADIRLREVLDMAPLTGFTVVAGAGSGKTTSLVKALAYVTDKQGPDLSANTQRVACITYTEVAAREIHDEIGNDQLASVSTIHSFLWSLIKPFQKDIALWVKVRIGEKLAELREKQSNYSSRTWQSTIDKDTADMEKLHRQAAAIDSIRVWTYGIGGDYARGILGHNDIIQMVPQLILERPLLARILARQYPIVFVDESQDTFADVVISLKYAWKIANGKMCLGFFGDPMQQIYLTGVGEIPREPGWEKIDKPENFRSSRRVLKCVNAVRAEGDQLQQISGLRPEEQHEGEAFFFVLPADDERSSNLERVRTWLDSHSTAGNWTLSDREGGSKVLLIVHRMAAERLGFAALYSAFHDNGAGNLSQAFDEGAAWPLTPFRDVILPLCLAAEPTSPEVLEVLKLNSPLIRNARASRQIRTALSSGRTGVDALRSLASEQSTADLGGLLRLAAERDLIELDPRMAAYLQPSGEHGDVVLDEAVLAVLRAMEACSLSELTGYYNYIKMESPYSTQHGTKGAEFDRVIVVLDDDEARHNQYSFDKFFGLKELSKTDRENQEAGKDSAVERTRRLFYVCVSRARKSLAIVLFAKNVAAATSSARDSILGEHVEIKTLDDLAGVH
ncbi:MULTISPECIES: UvrD-helicase domain-containing protein [Mycobacterium]|uniref:UvrD-helicase domain-containing protein n=1 Tax=Mycobacterium TaxID=1763 RepID=UPI0009E718EE|nr:MULTISPECIES: UvrD-helicase domain-containing protein [Mycobacterium]MDP7732144.1 UvrD-helicase domain-containing protein [Mycobacterium sp. TY813]